MKTQSVNSRAIAALDKAAQIVGSKAQLARSVGVTPQAAAQWFSRTRPIPPTRCRLIEQATDGAITRYDLRPDIFGEPEDRGAA